MPAKSDLQPDRHDLLTEIALFRYGLIAPLLNDPPGSGQQEAALRATASKLYKIPGSTRNRVSVTTLRRYLQTYQQAGFEGLRPGPRADTGQLKALSPEILEKAIALREEQPARTTAMVVELLKRDPQLSLAKPPNVHTLTTHLRQRGKTRRLLTKAPQTYKRFERDEVNALWQGDATPALAFRCKCGWPACTWGAFGRCGCPTQRYLDVKSALTCLDLSMTIAGWCPTPNGSGKKPCRD